MNFVGNYVLMCKKADFIQESWDPNVGDFFTQKEESIQGIGIITSVSEDGIVSAVYPVVKYADVEVKNVSAVIGNKEWVKAHKVWLPTQCQLQEILWKAVKDEWKAEDKHRACVLRLEFDNFLYKFEGIPERVFTTFEEIWLELVMFRLYNRLWNVDEKKWLLWDEEKETLRKETDKRKKKEMDLLI